VLPTIDRTSEGAEARWRPILQGPDILAMSTLARAMPPVCRAESTGTTSRGPDQSELLAAMLPAFVDVVTRARLTQPEPGTEAEAQTGPERAARARSLLDLLPARRGRRPKHPPVIEEWLDALSRPDPRLDASEDAIVELERGLAPWIEFGSGPAQAARAVFRLVEPPTAPGADLMGVTGRSRDAGDLDIFEGVEESGEFEYVLETEQLEPAPWRLEFLLQSVDDPSLIVPAEQAWDSVGGLQRWLPEPQHLLLAELGRASRIYPELETALRRARPTALDLDAQGAHRLLAQVAPLLDEAGIGVLLPSWWDRRRRIGLAASASTPTDAQVVAGGFGRDQLVDFDWQLAVDDEVLTEEEISALARSKAPLVRLRGQWVAMDPEQLRRGLDFLRGQQGDARTVADVLALASTHPDDANLPLPLNSVRADGWLGDLLSGTSDAALQPVEPPAGLLGSLRPYQERGLAWLSFLSSLGLGACLADDMGLGKTIQLLALEGRRIEERPGGSTTLLVCPMSLVGNWQREASRFLPDLRVYAHHGPERRHGADLDDEVAEADVVVTTYATATRDIEELSAYAWGRLVLDEAQAVKNSLSQSAKAVRRLDAGQRIALTGTPMENRLSELWAVMDFLNPGVLGSSDSFRARYAIPVERHGHTEPAERLRRITRPYILRRLKTDPAIIDDLPDKIEVRQDCRLTTEQASLYRAVVDDMMERIEDSEGIERRGNVLAAMTKLKQVCNHPAQVLHDHSAVARRSGKVIRLEEILEEILAEGDKVLCFTQFTEFAELLLPHLSARFGHEVLYLHGGTRRSRRDEMVQRFQTAPGPAVFLLSLKAGGTGLNLTAANHVVHLDRWWNPAVENQATDRAFRIGQKRNVQVHKFVCVGTLEERIDQMIGEKKALADLVISDGERWLTELSTNSLREVFALSEGAVDD
jgi:SNF2 family DNA or RNA helicase